ncbi:porin OmpC [Pantoea sp. At-9b]|uniref:porin OmpC n=1 Tax=Pantoea sp. (strain At-9b) TaxID=592316 RepID=UPI0001B3FB2C|nr:porin OmpC [Pantoea sp. At-9b]ADU69239.1 porin Gram-negative type [Pantoea sp. At-9b]
MNIRRLALLAPWVFIGSHASGAEIYNKDGNKLDLYGLVSGLHYFSDDKSQDGDQSYMRVGFKGQTQITDQLIGYGQWQSQFNTNQAESESDSMFTRLGFAGLKAGKYGSFDYGRNVGVLYDALSLTDMQPEFDALTYNTDQFMFRRGNSLATYRNSGFFGAVEGLDFTLQYQGKNDGGGEPGARDVLRQNGDGYGMSVAWAFGDGFKAVGAFTHSDRTSEQNSNSSGIMGRGAHAEAYSAALKYDAHGLYVATMYTQAYNASRFGSRSGSDIYGYANQSQIFEVFAQYTFDSGLVPFIAYNQARASDLGQAGNGKMYGNQDLVRFIDFGTSWLFNQNMLAYVDYKLNLIDSSDFTRAAGVSTDDVLAVGLVYQF